MNKPSTLSADDLRWHVDEDKLTCGFPARITATIGAGRAGGTNP